MPHFLSDLGRYRKYLSRRSTIDGRDILVFDGLFQKSTQRLLDEYFRKAKYSCIASDSDEYGHSKRWLLELAPRAVATEFFSEVDDVIRSITTDRPLELR